VLLCLGLVLLLPLAAVLGTGHLLNRQIDRLPGVFDGLDDRPAAGQAQGDGRPLTVLLLGTDRRSATATTGSAAGAPAWVPGAQRSDATMLLRISADRSHVAVISLPRDSWVEVPGHGTAKINAAYSWGGPRLAVETVERLTDVRIDHVAVVDWAGFGAMVDALGGIDVEVPETVRDGYRRQTWTAGRHHLDGDEALLYTGQRLGLPRGDLDRVRRQHVVLRALSAAALGAVDDPVALYRLVDELTEHLSVDDGWSARDMVGLALSLRGVRADDVSYLTVPVAGTGTRGSQSVVLLDDAGAAGLWQAVRDDEVEQWLAAHPEDATGHVVP